MIVILGTNTVCVGTVITVVGSSYPSAVRFREVGEAMNSEIKSVLQFIYIIDERINTKFAKEHGRNAVPGDKYQKLFEEVGEVVKAWKGKGDTGVRDIDTPDEIWDCIVTLISLSARYGFSEEQFLNGYLRTMDKLYKRWIDGKSGDHAI